jgi:hypothetical protein
VYDADRARLPIDVTILWSLLCGGALRFGTGTLERVIGKCWLDKHAAEVASHGVTFLGEDLSRHQPFCVLVVEYDLDNALICVDTLGHGP